MIGDKRVIKLGGTGISKNTIWMTILDNKCIVLLIFVCIVAQVASGGIFSRWANLSSVIRQASVTCILSMGYIIVLSTGMIDLSVGFMLSFCGIVYSELSEVVPIPIAIAGTLIAGFASGLFNGILSIKLKLIPFILTLGTAQIFRGVAYLLCNGISRNITNPSIKFIGQGIVFGFLPMTFLIFAVLAVLTGIMTYRTKFGRHVIATGGNIEAARVSGVDTDKTKILAFVFMGFVVSVASVVLLGRVAIAMPNSGQGMEMDAIAATIIGGTSLSGGKANVLGAVFGALVLSIISNLLNLAGVSSFWQWFSKGAIIVVAIFLDSATERFFQKRQIAD
ncbi:ribose ABC transporter permease [Spirochaetia bacterium]|nr:ribose ABC transporter permease [Spirochaetia bacterium]